MALAKAIHSNHNTTINHHIHARVEITAKEDIDAAASIINEDLCKLVSIMDHSSGQGQFPTSDDYIRLLLKIGYPTTEAQNLLEKKLQTQTYKTEHIRKIADIAKRKGCALASYT